MNSPYTLSNITSKDRFGVYKASVTYNGMSKTSTFFPDNWNRAEVLNATKEAYNSLSEVDLLNWNVGTTSSGMKIRMFINSTGELVTAFPHE